MSFALGAVTASKTHGAVTASKVSDFRCGGYVYCASGNPLTTKVTH